ncbi:MAG: prepilin-type N-terminal cleavage/methylation domain-containing protein [Terriglobia bacterium]
MGFSLIELLIVVAIILIIAAIAIPNFVRARIRANESSAAAGLRVVNNALATYSGTYQLCGYPNSLTRLAPANPSSNAAANLLDGPMANDNFMKSGYNYTYVLTLGTGDCAGPPGLTYEAEAQPVSVGQTGQRGFFTDDSFVIRADLDGDADAASPAL